MDVSINKMKNIIRHTLKLSLWMSICIVCTSKVSANSINKISDTLGYTIYIFLAPDCPISQQYTRTINQFYEKYHNEFEFIVYMGNKNSFRNKRSQLKFKSTYKFLPSIRTDINNHKARKLKATVTPEVYIVNKEGIILYHGAIDNWFFALGKTRPIITSFYLEDAIQNIIKGESIQVPRTTAIGCFLEYK